MNTHSISKRGKGDPPTQVASQWRKRRLKDLKKYQPRRLGTLNFHHPDEYANEFFQQRFLALSIKIITLFADHFSLPGGHHLQHLSWPADFDDQFITCVAKLARPSGMMDSWDDLLQNEAERNLIAAASIFMMLQDHVFDALLFGASIDQHKMLETQDQKFINRDGMLE